VLRPWLRAGGSSVVTHGGAVTLVDGASFCLSDARGDIGAGGTHGLYVFDTRLLSVWSVAVRDRSSETLAVLPEESFGATFLTQLGAALPSTSVDPALLLRRRRAVGVGMREEVSLQNLTATDAACRLVVSVACDAADVLHVKAGRPLRPRPETLTETGEGLQLERQTAHGSRGVLVTSTQPATIVGYQLVIDALVPSDGTWETVLQVRPVLDGVALPEPYPTGQPVSATHQAQRREELRRRRPVLRTRSRSLAQTLARTEEDLAGLRIADPEDPENTVIAAGAPWYLTLFGRDSLLTAWMTLPTDPGLAVGVLQALARLQGRVDDPLTEEQPGRIMHELRASDSDGHGVGVHGAYYGTADATPLFVMLVAELHRWGGDPAVVQALLPHVDRALDWIERADLDGDGFVEYERQTDQGLRNQGWKDSFDAVTHADGSLAQTPIALAEVQAYVYGAFRGRAELAAADGDEAAARYWGERAGALREAFNDRFWLPLRGSVALALDRDKKPCDVLASNMGHCLWTGILDRDKAQSVADHLMSPAMFSGWGIRTLATTEVAYNPMSYHNGSVWPHDNALAVAGLCRYGLVEPARLLARSLLEAAEVFGGRLPELFCGFDREEVPVPLPYAASCSPQAWASASPLLLLRALGGLDADVPRSRLFIDPAFPDEWLPIEVARIPLGTSGVGLQLNDSHAVLSGVPEGITVVRSRHEA
jgi:glycogen debranching enzyme